jgi:molybdate transport system substrate-binding protein
MAVKIAAAASLVNGLDDTIAAFKDNYPIYANVLFDVTYGSSGALARQIVNETLMADVFISASEEAMDYVETNNKMVSGTRFDFVANRLVIAKNNISGATYPAITSFENVKPTTGNMASTHIWLPNPYYPDYVPAGIYAEATFRLYLPNADHWGYAFGRAVYENTVRQDVQYTLNGVIGDAFPAIGVVYNSDAVGAGSSVSIIATAPNSINNTIIYPAARISQETQDAAAAAFLAYINDDAVRQIFIDNGFRSLAPLANN